MNITLSVDSRLVDEARKAAQAMGKSLNQAIRDYLGQLAGEGAIDDDIGEVRRLSAAAEGRSGGQRIDRSALHDRA